MHTGAGRRPDPAPSPTTAQGLWTGRVWRFAALPSTNTWAREHLGELAHGDVVWADAQTAGRGRFDRTWLAPARQGLTFSVVLRGRPYVSLAANLGQVAAWAVHRTLAGYDIVAHLKWPNDVMVQGRKIAGILVEQGGTADTFVVGIGLNVNVAARSFRNAGLDPLATSMRIERQRPFALRQALRSLLAELQTRLDQVAGEGLTPLLRAWSRHDWLDGQAIVVHGAGVTRAGRYEGLDAVGRLRLKDEDGREHLLWTGDVERLAVNSAGRRE
jgi:BirA family transcriptional regulator, biotin operon repressor / biotin---[acetyl-CoA-carboxylase] ligase